MSDLNINEVIKEVLELAREKGFGDTPENTHTMEKFALLHSEVSEAMEAYRHQKIDGPDGMAEELADVILRVAHLAGVHKIDLDTEIRNKLEKVKAREWDWDKMNESHS